jgi:hypothetical protein
MAVFWVVAPIIALMMETARSSETLVNFYQTTRRYNPEDSHLCASGICPTGTNRESTFLHRHLRCLRDDVLLKRSEKWRALDISFSTNAVITLLYLCRNFWSQTV